MKKAALAFVMSFALLAGSTVVAQDATTSKPKTEKKGSCCSDKKDKKSCCSSSNEKKTTCTDKKEANK